MSLWGGTDHKSVKLSVRPSPPLARTSVTHLHRSSRFLSPGVSSATFKIDICQQRQLLWPTFHWHCRVRAFQEYVYLQCIYTIPCWLCKHFFLRCQWQLVSDKTNLQPTHATCIGSNVSTESKPLNWLLVKVWIAWLSFNLSASSGL